MSETENLKESEVYAEQHEPWKPNTLVMGDEDDHLDGDDGFYVLVHLYDMGFDEKAFEVNTLLLSGMFANGSINTSIDNVLEQELKNKGDTDANSN